MCRVGARSLDRPITELVVMRCCMGLGGRARKRYEDTDGSLDPTLGARGGAPRLGDDEGPN